MAKTIATRKRIVRRDWTRADVKELRQHSKDKTPVKTISRALKRTPGASDKKPVRSESRSATAVPKEGERERSETKPTRSIAVRVSPNTQSSCARSVCLWHRTDTGAHRSFGPLMRVNQNSP